MLLLKYARILLLKYKSILLDVDGTIVPVGPNTVPSEKVIRSLHKATKRVRVCLVSGRCLNWLTELFRILDLSDPCIINGGSQIVNPKTGQIIWERALSPEDAKEILKIVKKDKISFIVNDNGIEYDNPQDFNFVKPLAIKLIYFDSKEKSDRCLKILETIPDISAHKVISWDKERSYRMEIYITHQEATKHHAAKELAKMLGVETYEMIGVGDSRNDIPLLNICGLKIAMGNADDKLKSSADYIAPSVDEDGVVHVVEKFILSD